MQIIATGFGTPDVLKAIPSEARSPGKDEVTIAVRAAAVNHRDLKMYESQNYTKGAGAETPDFPMPLGVEAAGVVTEAGPEAIGVAGPIIAGDEVIAYRIDGAYADTITVAAAQVVPKPRQLSWEQAASLMLTGTTAVHALAAIRARPFTHCNNCGLRAREAGSLSGNWGFRRSRPHRLGHSQCRQIAPHRSGAGRSF